MQTDRYLKQFYLFLLSIGLTVICYSLPQDKSKFVTIDGGLVILPDGSHMEGSESFGGIQPDYFVNMNESEFVVFLNKIKKEIFFSIKINQLKLIGSEDQIQTEILKVVLKNVQKKLKNTEYNSKPYLDLLKEYRLKKLNISIGSYLSCEAGVCRENALLTHLVLNALNIKNQYAYVRAQQGLRIEDHAFVVTQNSKGRWIIDTYNPHFHNQNFDELLEINDSQFLKKLSMNTEAPPVRILKINSFPKYWIPKTHLNTMCAHLFSNDGR